MITAYSATPLARHIDTPEQPQPVYTDLDAMIADMQADAAKIRKRFEHESPTAAHAKGRLAEHLVYDFVKDNPGVSTHEVAAHFDRAMKSIASLLSRMEERNALRSTMGRNPETKRPVRCFTVVATKKIVRDRRSQTQHVYDFIKANPGQGKAAIAEGCGLTVKQIEGALTNMSRYPSRFPIRREYENGMRSAVRVWAKEAAR
jgi:hypothetical protein